MKTVTLHEKGQRRLGDKLEFFYTLEPSESSVNCLIDSLKRFLAGQNKNVQEIIEADDERRLVTEYEAMRKYLGINAGKSQGDALGFIRLLLKAL